MVIGERPVVISNHSLIANADGCAVLANLKSKILNLKSLTLIAAILTYCLVVVGNIVRITDSGLGCPDWPLCYGNVIPVMRSDAIIEVAHRVFAAAVSVLVVVIAILNFRQRSSKTLVRLSIATLILLGVQILLGALTVWLLLHATIVAMHLAAGMALLGCMVSMTVLLRTEPQPDRPPRVRAFGRTTMVMAAAVYLLLITGGLVAGNGAALACNMSFPLCNGQLLPNGGSLVLVNWIHRAMVALVALVVAAVVWRSFKVAGQQPPQYARSARLLRVAATSLGIGFVLQATVGAVMVLTGRPPAIATLHNAVAAFTWVSALTLALLANRLSLTIPLRKASDVRPVPAWRQTISDYVALTKPRVISLLLVTTFAGMFVTPAGAPPFHLVVWTLIGGYLMAGGANAVNMAYDEDIDSVMGRTRFRPVPSGRTTSSRALAFGLVLAGLAFAILVLFVNILAALLAFAGFVYYTIIYTRWLKRTTWQNIVIGGGAGAIPPLVGWAAAYGQLTWAALFLFIIVFYWTPPHFWALALMKRKDYALAGVPMLPVIAGEAETTHQIWLYSWGMVALSLVLVPLQAMGLIYLVSAVALGAVFLWRAWQVNQDHTPLKVLSLYKYSLMYLALLFVAMVVDRMVVQFLI